MLIVAGTANFHSVDDMEAVLAEGQSMIAASLREAGCQDYNYARDVTDDKTMRIFELWDDQAALDAHFQEPHMAAFMAALAKVTPASISVKIYDVSGTRDLG